MDFADVTPIREEVSIEELDAALVALREAELDYEQKKKVSNEASHKKDEAKEKFMSLLQAAGKDRWEAEGYTGFSMYDELKWRVPQTPDDKERFFNFIKGDKVSELLGNDGRDIFLKYASVNAKSLGPLCKQIKELAANEGIDIEIPGLLPPTVEKKLRSLPKKRS